MGTYALQARTRKGPCEVARSEGGGKGEEMATELDAEAQEKQRQGMKEWKYRVFATRSLRSETQHMTQNWQCKRDAVACTNGIMPLPA